MTTPFYSFQPRLAMGKKLMRELVFNSWWVIVFILVNAVVLNIVFKQLSIKEQDLNSTVYKLETIKLASQKQQRDLKMQIESQNDPRYIEMVLKQELGLISEGQIKVHFID